MRFRLAVLFAVSLFAAACGKRPQDTSPPPPSVDTVPDVEPDQEPGGPVYRNRHATTVWKQFTRDEAAAQKKFAGQTFEMTCKVWATHPPVATNPNPDCFLVRGELSVPYLKGLMLFNVAMNCPKQSPGNEGLPTVVPGQSVTVRGKLTAFNKTNFEFILAEGRLVREK
jgi:hypothetical protein